MLPLVRVSDRARLVCTTDPDVVSDEDEPRWVLASETEHRPGALVAVIRPLGPSERARCVAGRSFGDLESEDPVTRAEAQREITAYYERVTELGVVAFEGGGRGMAVGDILRGMALHDRFHLGIAIIEQSVSSADPHGAAG